MCNVIYVEMYVFKICKRFWESIKYIFLILGEMGLKKDIYVFVYFFDFIFLIYREYKYIQ